jgi:hypothetical protein
VASKSAKVENIYHSLKVFYQLRYLLLVILLIIPSLGGIAVFGYYALRDWDSLQKAYNHFADLVKAGSNLETLFVAEAQQNIHRINLFADGVWTLLSFIIGAIGLHGVCTIPKKSRG